MKKHLVFTIIILTMASMLIRNIFAEKQSHSSDQDQVNTQNSKPLYAVVGGQEQGLTPFPNNERTRKIMAMAELEREGDRLAAQGQYEEALAKFYEAMKPEYLNEESDKSGAQGRIRDIHERQEKFDLALKEHEEWFYKDFPNHEPTINKHLELLALLESKKTNSSAPVYNHIEYLKKKYSKQLPPNGYEGVFSGGIISDIVHLYDYLGDADNAIDFMNIALKYLKDNNKKGINRFIIAEYERAKTAFEEDKRTGQKGHLQKVIETSNHIGW